MKLSKKGSDIYYLHSNTTKWGVYNFCGILVKTWVMEPGPNIQPTIGEVWPKPQNITICNAASYMIIRPTTFQFKVVGETCDILEAALPRYTNILLSEKNARHSQRSYDQPNEIYRGQLEFLEVNLVSICESIPYLGMNESYELCVDCGDKPLSGQLKSQTIWGILRGLETFVQLVSPASEVSTLKIINCIVRDFPKFPHRGLMIDTARHFYPVPTILEIVSGMEANKLNVLHWHIVDDQAFPYESKVFPELSEKGAYDPATHIYSQFDIHGIIEYCRLRGIRVVPEFDSPGHARSWGVAHPEILTTCYGTNGEPDGTLGPLDPSKAETYDFVRRLFLEIADVFPDNYFHIGGDEVDVDCWRSNPKVTEFMKTKNIVSNYNKLEEYYIAEVIKIIEAKNVKPIVWQEVFDNGLQLSKDAIVHVWKPGYQMKLQRITQAGHMALLSSCWYLDNSKTWKEWYACDPWDNTFTPQQQEKVLGGEACMWSESVNPHNVVSRIYPRTSVVAERLWSDSSQLNVHEATRRLEEFYCKLLRRNISSEPPNGPGFCSGETFVTLSNFT